MPFTKRITIERYKDGDGGDCAGLIEGETEAGDRWIIFLDADGKPKVYWPDRDYETGAVIGNSIALDRAPGAFSGVFEHLRVQDDADAWTEDGPIDSEVVSCFPVWHPGGPDLLDLSGDHYPPDTMRGIVFAVVPGEGGPAKKMRTFLRALCEGWGITTDPEPSEGVGQTVRVRATGDDPMSDPATPASPSEPAAP